MSEGASANETATEKHVIYDNPEHLEVLSADAQTDAVATKQTQL